MSERRAMVPVRPRPRGDGDVVFSHAPSADDLNGLLEMLDAQIRVLKRATGRPAPTAGAGGEEER
jgi:hypothetical protein